MSTSYLAYTLLANGALDAAIWAELMPAFDDFYRTSPTRKSATADADVARSVFRELILTHGVVRAMVGLSLLAGPNAETTKIAAASYALELTYGMTRVAKGDSSIKAMVPMYVLVGSLFTWTCQSCL